MYCTSMFFKQRAQLIITLKNRLAKRILCQLK